MRYILDYLSAVSGNGDGVLEPPVRESHDVSSDRPTDRPIIIVFGNPTITIMYGTNSNVEIKEMLMA